MKRVFVEAFEDESRPQGGHAVIVVQGVENLSDRPQFRLKPLDGGFIPVKRGNAKSTLLTPVSVRLTEVGVELVVGPEIVSNALLLAGTPVVIELPEPGVRGEFLWPSVAPLAPVRRRSVVGSRKAKPAAGSATAQSSLPDDHHVLAADLSDALNIKTLEGSDILSGASALGGVNTPFGASPRADGADTPLLGEGATTPPATPPSDPESAWAPDPKPLEWRGRQAVSRYRRGRLMIPGLFAAAAAVAVGVYTAPLWRGGTGWSPANARDNRAAPASPAQRDGLTFGPSASGAGPRAKDTGTLALGPASSATGGAPGRVCAKPEISTEALEAGRMRLRIAAPCRNGEEIRLSYADAAFVHRLDPNGALDMVFDAFAGPGQPLEIRFADGRTQNVEATGQDFARITKVAVLWKAPVNLDLHAYEYAATHGERGHVHELAPGISSAVRRETDTARRGRGFMSSSDNGRSGGDHLEVYTFFHTDDQSFGAVDLALDYESRGSNPAAGTCGADSNAEVAYRVVILERGATTLNEQGRIAAAQCGTALTQDVRFNRAALPVLKLRK